MVILFFSVSKCEATLYSKQENIESNGAYVTRRGDRIPYENRKCDWLHTCYCSRRPQDVAVDEQQSCSGAAAECRAGGRKRSFLLPVLWVALSNIIWVPVDIITKYLKTKWPVGEDKCALKGKARHDGLFFTLCLLRAARQK